MSDAIIPKALPIRVEIVVGDGAPVLVWAPLTPRGAACPRCGHVSHRVHRLDGRSVQDLPWRSIPVRWQRRCRKFWCDTPSCPQRVFGERWPTTWLRPYPQRTEAVWATITPWGWTASAADVARVATQQGLPVSADTVLRALRAAPDPPVADVRVVGIDEWALRQGRTYATIVVDPERHPGVDVWPDDQPDTVAAWQRAHPTIQGVTRDRDEAFAHAIATGAPDATPVAYRRSGATSVPPTGTVGDHSAPHDAGVVGQCHRPAPRPDPQDCAALSTGANLSGPGGAASPAAPGPRHRGAAPRNAVAGWGPPRLHALSHDPGRRLRRPLGDGHARGPAAACRPSTPSGRGHLPPGVCSCGTHGRARLDGA
jgi:hypothetical protein